MTQPGDDSPPLENERERRAMRDARMVTHWLSGDSFDLIAKREGISVERARQIIGARPGLKAERAKRRSG